VRAVKWKRRKRYPSDLAEAEWVILEPLMPQAKPSGHPRTVNIREVVNGIFYVLRGGIPWRFSPKTFCPGRWCTTISESGVGKEYWRGRTGWGTAQDGEGVG
jgi:transposase